MGEKMEIVTAGQVRKFNQSLYVLVPHETAKELGISKGARFKVFKIKQDRSLVYQFPPSNKPPADIQEPPV